MRSIETSFAFPLAAVKPLEPLLAYRTYCVDATRAALNSGAEPRIQCPACGSSSARWNEIEGMEYARCVQCSTLYLQNVPRLSDWARVLSQVSQQRNSPRTLHTSILQSRAENVYEPKLDWIHNTLRLHGVLHPRVLEVTTPPSQFSRLLSESPLFVEAKTIDESSLMASSSAVSSGNAPAEAAVLLESLDRAHDPLKLLGGVSQMLRTGGLVFVTALVCSGFDMVVLGAQNMYLYPPDRANCFSLDGLERLLIRAGYKPVELSTPGVLDVEIVAVHQKHNPSLNLSSFEQQLMSGDQETRTAFQSFLQQNRMSSFARVVARRVS